MSEIVTEFQFNVVTPFTYASKGENVDATFITLSAPTSKHSRECSALKQAFFRALPREEKKVDAPEKFEVSGTEVMTLIAMSKDVDLADVMDVGKKLLTNNLAMVEGEVKLTMNLIERMSQDDVESMIGEYMVNFTLASSLAKMNEK